MYSLFCKICRHGVNRTAKWRALPTPRVEGHEPRIHKGNAISKQTLGQISCNIGDGINKIKIITYHFDLSS